MLPCLVLQATSAFAVACRALCRRRFDFVPQKLADINDYYPTMKNNSYYPDTANAGLYGWNPSAYKKN